MVLRPSFLPAVVLLAPLWVGCDKPDPFEPLLKSPDASSAAKGGLNAPSGTDANPSTSSSIRITWIDNSTNEEGFRVERSSSSAGPWQVAGTTGPNIKSLTDGGRQSEQAVCYRVRAFKGRSSSVPSNIDCTIPPAAATELTASFVDHQAIDLRWKDNSAVEDGYEVQRATVEAGPYVVLTNRSANVVNYRDTGLETGTTYWYRVRARKDAGFGDFTNSASATPVLAPPKAPSEVNATPPYSSTVDITWADNSTNEKGFRVERSLDGGANWTTARTMAANATSSSDYGRTGEQQVCYRVIAHNDQGESPASNTDCTTPPAAPVDLTATGMDDQTIDLVWSDASAVEEGYEVQRTDGVEAYAVIAQLPTNSTSYRDTPVNSNTTYRYKVRALKDGGYSSFSNIASGTAATTAPDAPSGTNTRPWASTQVVITWSDNSFNEDGFRVERSIDGGATWATVTSASPYDFVDGGRTPDQEVCYRVFAFNNKGDSPPSNNDCTAPPAGPTNLTAAGIDQYAIQLTWKDNSAVEDGYQVWFISQEGWWDAVVLPANSTSYTVTQENAGICQDVYACSYAVMATKDDGNSDLSETVTPPPPPSGPESAAAPSTPSFHTRR